MNYPFDHFPLVCLTLSYNTIAEDVAVAKKYRPYVDLYELRADFLDEAELLEIRRFPMLVDLPVILTIRRHIDGGQFRGGEASRTMLFARALAFADQNPRNNFTYVDFEDDFHVPSLQESALAFGTRIIRSVHDMSSPITDLPARLEEMRKTGYELPKIACMPQSLADVTRMFTECSRLKDFDQIITGMGPLGLPTRLLARKLHSYLTFVSPPDKLAGMKNIGHIDPVTLHDVYHFKDIDDDTEVFGITGWPLTHTSSPELHNTGYKQHGINAVYIPVASENIQDVLGFADAVNLQGLSVTVPHKEAVLPLLDHKSDEVEKIGACNTMVRENGQWTGYNTDAMGFKEALIDFMGTDSLRHKRVAIIGAGGAAKAVACAIKQLGGKACIFNRTQSKAKAVAAQYGFMYAPLAPESASLLAKYSSLIIQTTSKGMGGDSTSSEETDPLWFYEFTGKERLFDIVYAPDVTPVMARARLAGCKVCNGMPMLLAQGHMQFKLFNGRDY